MGWATEEEMTGFASRVNQNASPEDQANIWLNLYFERLGLDVRKS